MKISRFFFGSSKYSPYLCHRLQDDSSLSGRATVSPKASSRRLFLCQRISSQLENFIFLTGKVNMAAAWTVRFDLSSRISHHLVTNGECSRHPFIQSAVNGYKMMHYAEFYFIKWCAGETCRHQRRGGHQGPQVWNQEARQDQERNLQFPLWRDGHL